jgi:hypothetical protein
LVFDRRAEPHSLTAAGTKGAEFEERAASASLVTNIGTSIAQRLAVMPARAGPRRRQ